MLFKVRRMNAPDGTGCVDTIYDGFDRFSVDHVPAGPETATSGITEAIIMDADTPEAFHRHVFHVRLIDTTGKTPERVLGINAKAWLMSDAGKTVEALDLRIGVRSK